MNINDIKNGIEDTKTRISKVEDMIEDFNNCKSETSKKVLEAAIVKIGKEFLPTTETPEG